MIKRHSETRRADQDKCLDRKGSLIDSREMEEEASLTWRSGRYKMRRSLRAPMADEVEIDCGVKKWKSQDARLEEKEGGLGPMIMAVGVDGKV